MDSFYTPPALADLLTSLFTSKAPSRIVDFAAGDGALLRSAVSRWPDAEIVAMDVDENAIRALSAAIPHAHLRHGDFLLYSEDGTGTGNSKERQDFFDLVLLNPPFSCRGSSSFTARVGEKTIRASRAMAFVARALRYIRDGGELIAIVPSSCLTSERDSELRAALDEHWHIESIGELLQAAFPRCDVTVDVIRATRRKASNRDILLTSTSTLPDISRGRLLMMRGTIPVSKSSASFDGLPFIHSTNLIAGSLTVPTRRISPHGRSLSGTALLLPRVGRPNVDKMVLKTDPGQVVLSDCVVALKTPDRLDESALYGLLRENWPMLRRVYSGSCALYLTMGGLGRLLERFGYVVERVGDLNVPTERQDDHAANHHVTLENWPRRQKRLSLPLSEPIISAGE